MADQIAATDVDPALLETFKMLAELTLAMVEGRKLHELRNSFRFAREALQKLLGERITLEPITRADRNGVQVFVWGINYGAARRCDLIAAAENVIDARRWSRVFPYQPNDQHLKQANAWIANCLENRLSSVPVQQ